MCVSATTGAGMGELRTAIGGLAAGLPVPDPRADVRFWVDRSFTIRGAGTVVTGTLAQGRLRVGDELELASADGATRAVTVRALQSLGRPVQQVRGVARVAVNLRGVPREAVARGDVLLTPRAWLTTDLIDVRLHGLRPDAAAAPAAAELPGELTAHIGSAALPARVRPLGPDTVRLRLRHQAPLRVGDRIVLRDPGRRRVSAGATVLDVRPPEFRRRGAAVRRAEELAAMDGLPSAEGELARRAVVRRVELLAMGVPAAELDALAHAGVPAAAGWLVDPARALAAVTRLAAAVATHDEADPLDPGLPTEAARRVAELPEPRLVEAVLRYAAGADPAGPAAGLVVRDGRVTRGAATGLPPAVRAALDALRADLTRDPFAAPEAARLAELGLGPRPLASLVRAGELLRLADGVVLLPGSEARAVEVLAGLGEEFTLSEARQALGTTRRVAVPLLDHRAASADLLRPRGAPGSRGVALPVGVVEHPAVHPATRSQTLPLPGVVQGSGEPGNVAHLRPPLSGPARRSGRSRLSFPGP